MKGPRDLEKESDWFRWKKISQKLKYLNFKREQSKRYFSSHSVGFTTLRMSNAESFVGDRRNQALTLQGEV